MAKEITYPLGLKFAMIIMAICLVMGLVIVAFGYRLFADQNHQQYTDHGRTLVTASSKYVNWDNINHYLETGETDEEYATTLENLQVFAEAAGAEYLYVLVPTEEGNLYVYDSDPSTGHIVLGETIAREEEYD